MSLAALNWAFQMPGLRPAQKAVLVALADHADESGQCFPSIGRLMQWSSLSERAVRNALRELENYQLLVTEHKEGHRSGYDLSLDTPAPIAPVTPAPRAAPPRQHMPHPRQEMPGTPAPPAPKPLLTTKEPKSVPTERRSAPESRVHWLDAREQLWGEGLPILRGLTGKPDGASRAFLGRLLKAARDDCPSVMRVLREAADLRPAEPAAWLTAAVSRSGSVDAAMHRVISNMAEENEKLFGGMPH